MAAPAFLCAFVLLTVVLSVKAALEMVQVARDSFCGDKGESNGEHVVQPHSGV